MLDRQLVDLILAETKHWPSEEVRQQVLDEAWDDRNPGETREHSDLICELRRLATYLIAKDVLQQPTNTGLLQALIRTGFGLHGLQGDAAIHRYNEELPSLRSEELFHWEALIRGP